MTVRVLGPVEVVGAIRPFERTWASDLVVYLALHPAGASNDVWATALWPDRVMAAPTLHSTVSAARRSLGRSADGTDRLPRRRGVLFAGDEVTTDWHRLVDIAHSGDPRDWRSGLDLVRGRPFDGLRSSDWTVLEGWSAEIEDGVVALALRAAGEALDRGDGAGAAWAARRGLRAAMEKDPKVVLMGEDIGKLGGVFRVTEGLQKDFGEDRVIDTPLAESGIIGTAVGLALRGYRPVCEIQFDGFVFPAVDQISSQLAKLHYRSQGRGRVPGGGPGPVGGGVGGAEHPTREPEAPFGEYPGTYGPERLNPVVYVKAITMRRDVPHQTLLHGGRHLSRNDAANLCGLNVEALAWRTLTAASVKVTALYAPPAATGLHHLRVAIRQTEAGQSRAAIAALLKLPLVKHIFVVDDDIDPRRDEAMEWALATRFPIDRDVVSETGPFTMPMDPTGEKGKMAKAGFDLTRPFGAPDIIENRESFPPHLAPRPRFQTVRQALENGPCHFIELMEAMASNDGREIALELDRLQTEGILDRAPGGAWRLASRDGA